MTDQENKFIAAQKHFLALADKVEKYRACGQNPPEHLLKKYEDAKCELNDLSFADKFA